MRPFSLAIAPREHVYLVRDLETGTESVMLSTPYRLGPRERWSWRLGRVVLMKNNRQATERRGTSIVAAGSKDS